MSAKITSLGKPTVSDEHRREVEEVLAQITKMVKDGDAATLIAVVIRPDRNFRMMKAGAQTRIETVGMLEQIQFDLLMSETPLNDPLNK